MGVGHDRSIPNGFRSSDHPYIFDFNVILIGRTYTEVPCQRGLFQGPLLSPILFNIFIIVIVKNIASTKSKSYAIVLNATFSFCGENLYGLDDLEVRFNKPIKDSANRWVYRG